jgi:cellulose biosynthesis protein BcsQ
VRSGKSVLLIDTDSKKSTTARKWTRVCKTLGREVPTTIAMAGEDVPSNVDSFAQNQDAVIIDGTPDLDAGTLAVMSAVDVVISPVEASWFALWELEDTFKEFKRVAPKSTRFYAALGKTKANEDLGWAIDFILKAGIGLLPCALNDSVEVRRNLDVLVDKPNHPAAKNVLEFLESLLETIKKSDASPDAKELVA